MENQNIQKKKRGPRSVNFTGLEKSLLFDLVDKQLGLLRSKFGTNCTDRLKKDTWDEVGMQVSSLGVALRTGEKVKEKWGQMMSKAKDHFAKQKGHQRATGGGGRYEPPSDPVLQRIIERFEHDASFQGVVGGFESAMVPPTAAASDEETVLSLETIPCPLPPVSSFTQPESPKPGDEAIGQQSWQSTIDTEPVTVLASRPATTITNGISTGQPTTSQPSSTVTLADVPVCELVPLHTTIQDTSQTNQMSRAKRCKLSKITGSSKAAAKALLKDAMREKKTQQDILNKQHEVMVATLTIHKEKITTHQLWQEEAKFRIEKLKLEIELLKEKRLLDPSDLF